MSSFNPDRDIPDLSGKVILVTGGNVGLGKQTILQLSKHNPKHIFLAARSETKSVAAIEEIRKVVPNAAPITYINLDLTSFDSIKQAVKDFHSHSESLHILVNNAGIMATPAGVTKEGYEIQFGTNHLGHALLTKLLLPTLKKTVTASSPPHDVRIINVASSAEASSPATDTYKFDKLKTDMASTSTVTRYGISKVANIHHARALSRRHPEIRSISLHPGVVNTNLTNGVVASWPIMKPFMSVFKLFSTSVWNGTKNQLWAAVSPDAKSGEFYFPVGVTGKGSKQSRDKALEEALWDWTERELEGHI
ncbi:Putative short-chain dehydrogenase/reductase SDR, NAD(P)-binding domain superfamily [Colletotrichum destructivum]|uniref:Short-chain dehydrogenase/reductase SDR, NAD(P)-binding domain superfamily n=1 Tax=Colletotrichum destructivum TaxID=34406 RepID=A0AAX4I9R0_9PEZI|nr:Putative short-chain dehydrogenase/reductase SDR, NAD(P)-binding domain superfamily [Colletotrichum destructivum]